MDKFGYFYYDRVDIHLTDEQKLKVQTIMKELKPDKFIGQKVIDIQTLDGTKIFLEDKSWILFRPSGTEPLLRVYCEATSPDKVKKMLREGEMIIKS